MNTVKLRSLKSQSSVLLNKISDALNKGRYEQALALVEKHRSLNTRVSVELSRLHRIKLK